MNFRIGMLAAAAVLAMATSAVAAEAPLKVIWVDVEGGAATLFVTPQGKSLLMDAGWPASRGAPRPPPPGQPAPPPQPPAPSSAERIVEAAKAAGLTKLDYLLITHYHVDHVGGVSDLIARFPIDTVIDHGPNREDDPAGQGNSNPALLYPAYLTAIAGKKHMVMKAGEKLQLGDLTFTAVQSDRQITPPLPGAGMPGVGCPITTSRTANGGEENLRSLGVLAQWGAARLLALGDTTWEMEKQLICPLNVIGKVDLMITNNHGSDTSTPSELVQSVRPTTVVVNNGSRKGGDPLVLDRVAAVMGRDAIWQVHFSTRAAEKNAPLEHIANIEGGPDVGNTLTVSVTKAGDLTFTNPRTGTSKTYPKAR